MTTYRYKREHPNAPNELKQMLKFVQERISKINIALCYEQTSPLDVYTYDFGFSLSILHYFSKTPKEGAAKQFCFAAPSADYNFNNYIMPCAIIAVATFLNPAMFAPATKLPAMPYSAAADSTFL